jgi:6-phosphogluconolactonase/glucosamine-6-phosphate isomerase/deaminase
MTDANIIQTNDSLQITTEVAEEISRKLQADTDVTWFLSGGSSVELEVAVRKRIKPSLSKGKLHICLIDERFGSIGHKNSNWQQLINQGFEFENCEVHPLLDEGLSQEQAAKNYSQLVHSLLDTTYTIALFGIGSDGHTAGLLPFNSIMNSDRYYNNYQAEDFVRITATPKLVSRLDHSILYAMGEHKEDALHQIFKNGSMDEVPARILLSAKQLTIITNQNIERKVL